MPIINRTTNKRTSQAWQNLGFQEQDKITNIAIQSQPKIDKQQFWLGYINGETETLATFLFELRKIAYTQNNSNIGIIIPCQENILKSLDRAEYKRTTHHDIFVYQWENNKP